MVGVDALSNRVKDCSLRIVPNMTVQSLDCMDFLALAAATPSECKHIRVQFLPMIHSLERGYLPELLVHVSTLIEVFSFLFMLLWCKILYVSRVVFGNFYIKKKG